MCVTISCQLGAGYMHKYGLRGVRKKKTDDIEVIMQDDRMQQKLIAVRRETSQGGSFPCTP